MRPRKALGQHLLVDASHQRRIVEALRLEPQDEVVEIGPGTGALTQHLVGRVRRLVLIELDAAFAADLTRRFEGVEGVVVIASDVLRLDLCRLVRAWEKTKVVGNIPYRITSPLLSHLLGHRPRPAEIVFTLQKEVAERLAAPPGGKTYGALSVGVRAVAEVRVLGTIPKGAFRPIPKVDSAVVRIVPHAPPRLTPGEEEDLRALTRAAFGRRRKQLQTILRKHPSYALSVAEVRETLSDLGVPESARPETLPPETFVELARALHRRGRPRPIPGGRAA